VAIKRRRSGLTAERTIVPIVPSLQKVRPGDDKSLTSTDSTDSGGCEVSIALLIGFGNG
jgi:hypothetical protein